LFNRSETARNIADSNIQLKIIEKSGPAGCSITEKCLFYCYVNVVSVFCGRLPQHQYIYVNNQDLVIQLIHKLVGTTLNWLGLTNTGLDENMFRRILHALLPTTTAGQSRPVRTGQCHKTLELQVTHPMF
jgi:hypothetical protein